VRYSANLRFLAANLAAAGHTDEAREVSQALLAVEPRFQVGRFAVPASALPRLRRPPLAHLTG
jgi:hypothetical protein